MIGKMVPKLLNNPEVKKLLKKVKEKNTSKSISKSISKSMSKSISKSMSKPIRYVSSSKSGVVTSGGLLSKNLKISKKKLLGS
tara:strand:+ start:14 stop:262 length:249 start_codon:yes stop_codon:yes gene_type:complete